MAKVDKELEEFRNIMEVPSTFDEGFRWSSLLGAVFVALLMVPGAIYMGLLAGSMEIAEASRWVTVILFIEVAKRAHRTLTKAEIFVLFFMASAAMGAPFSGLLWNQFFVNSDAAAATGISEQLPLWFAPPRNSESYDARSFFHLDWLPVIGMTIFGTFFGQLSNLILGYGLFRVTSDLERLPFPMAPIGAQGIVAMAEDLDDRADKDGQMSWRWRVFAIGGAIGLTFGFIYLLLPTLSGAITGRTIQILPIPFSDFTGTTGRYLPAVATGLSWDFGNLIVGMVMPYFGMLGSFIGLVVTMVANPLLYKFGILHNWKYGDDTIATIFKNNVDFYFSLQIGIALAIAVAGLLAVIRSVRAARAKQREAGGAAERAVLRPEGRGDIRTWIVVACYLFVTLTYIGVSALLLRWHHGEWTGGIRNIVLMLLFLGFVYTPLISYVTARLEGMVGQVVEIPMIREAALILSGYRGVACWFLPLPMANYGQMTVFYRQCELTGTRFTSIWKAKIFLYPIILISSIFFMNFIWGLAKVPSSAYPYALKMWELNAANQCIMFSSTMGEYSMFEEAFNWRYLSFGAVFGGVLFGAMNLLGAPVMLVYGVVRGLGQSLPHAILPQFIGAVIGRFYFQKRLGLKWRQYIPVVAAGFACGMGLITTVGVGITFLNKAIIKLPF
ncbi:MAG: peptide transporter [Verrucomicrobia bacterium]|nr:peptide transporter [Verrucomicrobiota bacterium]MDA1085682.1 peptide transporter [Verrucomicrobiota bacterium]